VGGFGVVDPTGFSFGIPPANNAPSCGGPPMLDAVLAAVLKVDEADAAKDDAAEAPGVGSGIR